MITGERPYGFSQRKRHYGVHGYVGRMSSTVSPANLVTQNQKSDARSSAYRAHHADLGHASHGQAITSADGRDGNDGGRVGLFWVPGMEDLED